MHSQPFVQRPRHLTKYHATGAGTPRFHTSSSCGSSSCERPYEIDASVLVCALSSGGVAAPSSSVMSADGAEAAEDVAPVPFSFKVAGGKATLKLAITEVALAQLEAELGLPQYQPAADGSASGSGAGCAGVVSDAVKASGRAARLVRTAHCAGGGEESHHAQGRR